MPQVASSIKKAGGEALSVPGDVTAQDFAPNLIKATIEKYGALHILVNNAGDWSLTCWSSLPTCRRLHNLPAKREGTKHCCHCNVEPFLAHCSVLSTVTILPVGYTKLWSHVV